MLILTPTSFELETLFGPQPDPGKSTVSLAGTEPPDGVPARIGVCGFGLAGSGIATMEHLRQTPSEHVLLVGIAGSFDLEAHPTGAIRRITEAHGHGIGAGEGDEYLSAEDLGFPQLPAGGSACIELDPPPAPLDAFPPAPLLSVASASGNSRCAQARARLLSTPGLEDMEAWSVAQAARLFGARVSVIRAVSNAVGDRDSGRWQLAQAFQALRTALAPWMPR